MRRRGVPRSSRGWPAPGCCWLAVRRSPDDAERTDIVYDPQTERLLVARDRASLSASAAGGAFTAPLALGPGETLELRVVVDASIVEIVANRRVVMTLRDGQVVSIDSCTALAAAGGVCQ